MAVLYYRKHGFISYISKSESMKSFIFLYTFIERNAACERAYVCSFCVVFIFYTVMFFCFVAEIHSVI